MSAYPDSDSDSGEEYRETHACVYKQTILVNPMIGGFSPFDLEFKKSEFKSYEFFESYKVSAQNNQVIFYTTNTCSQMSISFDFGCVVYQPKVKPQKRATDCKQLVKFKEQKYSIQLSPFDKQDVDVGLVIFASGNNLIFLQLKLKSLTNVNIIALQLHDFVRKHLPIQVDEINETSLAIEQQPEPSPMQNTLTSFSYTLIPGPINISSQSVVLDNPFFPSGNKFIRWEVRMSDGITVVATSKPDTMPVSAPYPMWSVQLNKITYVIGFLYQRSTGSKTFYGTSVSIPVSNSVGTLKLK